MTSTVGRVHLYPRPPCLPALSLVAVALSALQRRDTWSGLVGQITQAFLPFPAQGVASARATISATYEARGEFAALIDVHFFYSVNGI